MIAGAHVVMWLGYQPPGNDACRFALTEGNLIVEGSCEAGGVTHRYRVRAGASGITRRARLIIGRRAYLIERDAAGNWTMGGKAVPEVAGLEDIDLGFTPATNTLPIRRLALSPGAGADVTAAWFDPADHRLKPLRQRYDRTGPHHYRYAAPDHGVTVDLTVDDFGAVRSYPGYWDATV
ncbi:MAG: putative glycolipid-binding domain-containing protein [Rhodobacteraceae bacterium]|nr:putative glycolipid-binding domain-containing protein [Paracoccaceae bacterium]